MMPIVYDMCAGRPGFQYMICKLSSLLNSLIPLLITLGVVYLVWGIVQYVIGSDEEAKTRGKDKIIFGIIGLAVIVSLWGLVFLVVDTFRGPYGGLDQYGAPVNLQNKLLPRQ